MAKGTVNMRRAGVTIMDIPIQDQSRYEQAHFVVVTDEELAQEAKAAKAPAKPKKSDSDK